MINKVQLLLIIKNNFENYYQPTNINIFKHEYFTIIFDKLQQFMNEMKDESLELFVVINNFIVICQETSLKYQVSLV